MEKPADPGDPDVLEKSHERGKTRQLDRRGNPLSLDTEVPTRTAPLPEFRHPEPDPAEVQDFLDAHANKDKPALAPTLYPTENADSRPIRREIDESVTHQ